MTFIRSMLETLAKKMSVTIRRISFSILIVLGVLMLTQLCFVVQDRSSQYPTQRRLAPSPKLGYSTEQSGVGAPYPKCSHILTLRMGGRWANLVMEYASLYGVIMDNKGFGIKPVLNDIMKAKLQVMFPNLSIPSFKEMGCSDKDLRYVTSEQVSAGILQQKWNHLTLSLPIYWLRKRYIKPVIDDLKQNDFRFDLKIVHYVQKGLQGVKEDFLKNRPKLNQAIFVGLHVRRTDYPRYLKTHNGTAVTENYFYKALDMFRDKFGSSVVFVSATDDQKWVEAKFSKFSDVYFSSKMDTGKIDPVHFDFALLSHCNHSIYSYGTYGFMTSILAGGHVIAADAYSVDKFLAKDFAKTEKGQNWTLIKDPVATS
ncbi:galactoside alpha-(1,2)-fucosyltransferase 1-like isoform X2 [Tigriopus californicus]|nr:galactoside alpha-(1,2)-fucosyltransferase 1-like isoform X2 [Tigriopus californicus]